MQRSRKLMAAVLSAALVLTGLPAGALNSMTANAAKKPSVSLNKKSVKITQGKKVTLKVKKSGVKKVKSIKWSTNKKKIATVSKKGVVKAVKAGSAKITAKVKYQPKKSSKTVSKKLFCKVTVVEDTTPKEPEPVKSSGPSASPSVSPSAKPSAQPSGVPTAKPSTKPSGGSVVKPSMQPSGGSTAKPSTKPSGGSAEKPSTQPSEDPAVIPTEEPTEKPPAPAFTPGQPSADMTAADLMEDMNQGWNLGNTFECAGIEGATTVGAFETGWGQPKTTKKMIQGVKASGFDSIRIPVAWSNMMEVKDGEYIVSEKYLRRVAEVVQWCIDEGMYVVLNEHYDGGWWGLFGAANEDGSANEEFRERGMKKYKAIWTQVADYFKDYDYHLIFESANEELGAAVNEANLGLNTALDADGNPDEKGTPGILTEDELFAKVADINQEFVNVVRASGGNNPHRQLLIAGYNTNLGKTCDERFIMPTDTAENGKDKLSISVHYYDPGEYCIGEDKTSDWYSDSWGTEEEIAAMHASLDTLEKFTDQGYGVIIGEYGPQGMTKKGIPEFIYEIMTYCEEKNYAPMLWNNSIYNRYEAAIAYTDIYEVLKKVTKKEDIPLEEGAEKTGTLSSTVVTEADADVKVVATWEGLWTRTNQKSENVKGECIRGPEEIGQFETTSQDEGITIDTNKFWWQVFFTYDWKTIEGIPGVRITMATDGVSKDANFQLDYCKEFDKSDRTPPEYDRDKYEGKYMTLSEAKLEVKPYIVLTSATPGATITKIEILDVKPKE